MLSGIKIVGQAEVQQREAAERSRGPGHKGNAVGKESKRNQKHSKHGKHQNGKKSRAKGHGGGEAGSGSEGSGDGGDILKKKRRKKQTMETDSDQSDDSEIAVDTTSKSLKMLPVSDKYPVRSSPPFDSKIGGEDTDGSAAPPSLPPRIILKHEERRIP